ncbi:MAG: type II toxin-antitoxin system death-on-curing family toxin [Succinimonas sp.]|nr:type II toxin-antitoxin system death-on-curing family toxin [Succinimonas sp.]
MKMLTAEQVKALHEQLFFETAGSDGIRDNGLLEAAVLAPFQSFGGREVFPGIMKKAARLGYGLIKNHAFIDGNKRIGVHAMLVFLALNGVALSYTQEELYDIVMKTAAGEADGDDLLRWLLDHEDSSCPLCAEAP